MADDVTPETENHRLWLAATFPHVSAERIRIVVKYGHLLNNTGGNDPLDLLNDLHKPHPNGLMRSNSVRFALATMVEAQVFLLIDMEKKGMINAEPDVLSGILRRFLGNTDNRIGTNGAPSDAALDLNGVVALQNEAEFRAVWDARES